MDCQIYTFGGLASDTAIRMVEKRTVVDMSLTGAKEQIPRPLMTDEAVREKEGSSLGPDVIHWVSLGWR